MDLACWPRLQVQDGGLWNRGIWSGGDERDFCFCLLQDLPRGEVHDSGLDFCFFFLCAVPCGDVHNGGLDFCFFFLRGELCGDVHDGRTEGGVSADGVDGCVVVVAARSAEAGMQ